MTATTLRPFRAIPPLLASAALVGLLSACHILVEKRHPGEYWYHCDAFACYLCDVSGCFLPPDDCLDDEICDVGACDPRRATCVESPDSCTEKADCAEGHICRRGACRPLTSPCRASQDCGDGAYCRDGQCEASALCRAPRDCGELGSGFTCDVRGTCVPALADQPQTCRQGSDCADGLCVDGLCGVCSGDCGGGRTCDLERHCGADRSCLDGRCVARCQSNESSVCGSNQQCNAQLGVCVAVQDPSECADEGDCGSGSVCLNGACHVQCGENGACAHAADVCIDAITVGTQAVQICRADHRAQPECQLSRDCDGAEQCVNGACRTTCLSHADCEACEDGPVCGRGGFCMTETEARAQCQTNSDCTKGQVCLDAQCV